MSRIDFETGDTLDGSAAIQLGDSFEFGDW